MVLDPIERRLKALDEEDVTIGQAFSEHAFAKSPMILCAIALVIGIVLQKTFSLPPVFWLILMSVFLPVCFIISCFAKGDRKVWTVAIAAFMLFACVGGARLNSFYRPKANDIRNFVGDERTPAVVRGMVISRVRLEDRDRWVFGRYVWGDPGSSFYIKLSQAKMLDGWADSSGMVRVQASDKIDNIEPGDMIEVYCWLDRFDAPSNPGQFDVAKYLKGRGVYISASVKSAGGISKIKTTNDKSSVYAAFIKIREKIKLTAEASLLGEGYWEESDQGLASALLLGHRGKIDSNTYQAFVRTGLAHFISLSGLHMGMLAGLVWWICRTAGLGKRSRAFVTIIVIGVYILALPPRAPTMRAAIMCWFFCLSVLVRRKSNSLNAISLSAIILLLIRPTDVFNAGWQLSFSTVLGIILLQERIWLKLLDIFYFNSKTLQSLWHENKYGHLTGRSMCCILGMISVGLAAWIGGAGVLLYHFGVLTPTACLWTVIVFPIVAVILAAGFFQIIAAMLLPTLALGLGIIVESTSNFLSWTVELIAKIDTTQISIGKTGISLIVLYYIGLCIVRFNRITRPYIRRIISTAAIALMIVPSIMTSISKDVDTYLELTCLNIGHGQAIVISTPKGENILIDAGSLTTKDCGSRIVLPFLKEKGIGKLDAIFISHDDIDHLNGIPEIISGLPVDHIYVNTGFIKNAQTRSSGGYLHQWLAERGHKLQHITNGMAKIKGAKITPLWPSEDVCLMPDVSDNDKSQVFVIEYAGRKIMICSDIETMPQKRILQTNPEFLADAIIMPHHGSKTNLVDNFFDKLGAKTIIASCSPGRYENAFKPPPESNIKGFYTPTDGAITIKIKKDGHFSVKGFVPTKRI